LAPVSAIFCSDHDEAQAPESRRDRLHRVADCHLRGRGRAVVSVPNTVDCEDLTMRRQTCTWMVAFGLPLLARVAGAQSTGSIAGTVKDASGAVMPGVTVEAASPALIEKVRVVITDSDGQYKLVDLRPGTYAVSFSLPGFGTVTREGIELNISE